MFKAILIFQNPKIYGLNIVKKNIKDETIDNSDANFSINMYEKFDIQNNQIGNLSVDHSIKYSNGKDIEKNNIKTVDGVISLNDLLVDNDMINKTYYYLITENSAPEGYNSIGSLVVAISFDLNGNPNISEMWHVKNISDNNWQIMDSQKTDNTKNIVTVKTGDKTTATAEKDFYEYYDNEEKKSEVISNRIRVDIQQEEHEDSYYDLQLEKKDASDNNQLAGVKFKVSNVKINNSDIKNNNNENAFSITSKKTVSNVINEIYTNANDDSKNKIGKETQVLNSNDTTDTYTIEETESITGYELNTIKTNLKFYKKNENSNIKNDHASVVFDTKNADGNYVSGNELQITDGYFVSSLDSTASTNDDRKVENLDNYINSLKNENIVIVYYAKGKISVQYYNKLEGTYSVVLNKYVNNRVSNDSSINFKISLYKNKNSNNEFSETDEIKEVQTKKGTVKL